MTEDKFLVTPKEAQTYLNILLPKGKRKIPSAPRELLVVPPGTVYHRFRRTDSGLVEITLNIKA